MRSVSRPVKSKDRSRVKASRLNASPRRHSAIRSTNHPHTRKRPNPDSPSDVEAVACPERSCCPTRRAAEKTLVSISSCVLCFFSALPLRSLRLCGEINHRGAENAEATQRKPLMVRTQISIRLALRVRVTLAATTRTGCSRCSAVPELQRDFDD